jgi:hypothetical protein
MHVRGEVEKTTPLGKCFAACRYPTSRGESAVHTRLESAPLADMP